MKPSRGILIVAGLVLLVAACGGSDETTGDPTTTTAASSSETTSTTTAEETTTTSAVAVSGDSDSEYCNRVREAQSAQESPLDFSFFFGSSPEEIQAQFEKNLEVLAEWPEIAPPEIEADAETIVDYYEQFVERGNELQWNIQAMADDEFFNSGFDDPALEAATTNLDNYTRDVCGVDFDQQPTAPPATGGDGALGELLGDLGFPIPTDILSEENLECLATELETLLDSDIGEGYVPTADDIDLFINALETCGLG